MKEYDNCVNCGKETEYKRSVPVDFRDHYVEGAGQLCPECFNKIYKEK